MKLMGMEVIPHAGVPKGFAVIVPPGQTVEEVIREVGISTATPEEIASLWCGAGDFWASEPENVA